MQKYYISPDVVAKMNEIDREMFVEVMLNTPSGFENGHYYITSTGISMLSSAGLKMIYTAINNTIGTHKLYYNGIDNSYIHIFLGYSIDEYGNPIYTDCIMRLYAIMDNKSMELYGLLDIPPDVDTSIIRKETIDTIITKIRENDACGKYNDMKHLVLCGIYDLA